MEIETPPVEKRNVFGRLFGRSDFSLNQKISVINLLLLLLVLPLGIIASLNPVKLFQKAATETFGFGKNLRFDGLTSYVKVLSGKNLPDLNSDFTIEMWLKPKVNPLGGIDNYILVKMSNDFRQYEYLVTKEPMNKQGDGPIYFVAYNNGDPKGIRGNTSLISDGNHWYHLAITKKDQNIKIFINGKIDKEEQFIINPGINSDFPLYIGTNFMYSGELESPFIGDLEELRISNSARYLTAFNPQLTPFDVESSALAIFRFNNDLTDSSWNKHETTASGKIEYVENDIIPPTITPTAAPTDAPAFTPTPTITRQGAYRIDLSNPHVTLVCQKGDPNCYFNSSFRPVNIAGQALYNTTIYAGSSPQNLVKYIGFDSNWTSGQSKTTKIVPPGEAAISSLVKMIPPAVAGEYSGTLYVDGQTCNNNVNPPDCYYYGAGQVNIKIKVVDNLNTTQTPTPLPTKILTPTPTYRAIPTSTPVVNSPPTISTKYLPSGRRFFWYTTAVKGEDINVNDTLTMNINNLPKNLAVKSCKNYIGSGKRQIVCYIEGRNMQAGKFNIEIKITDSYKNSTTKILPLIVQ